MRRRSKKTPSDHPEAISKAKGPEDPSPKITDDVEGDDAPDTADAPEEDEDEPKKKSKKGC